MNDFNLTITLDGRMKIDINYRFDRNGTSELDDKRTDVNCYPIIDISNPTNDGEPIGLYYIPSTGTYIFDRYWMYFTCGVDYSTYKVFISEDDTIMNEKTYNSSRNISNFTGDLYI